MNKQLQDHVEAHSKIIEEMVTEIVSKYADDLDKYIYNIERVLNNPDEEIDDNDLNRIMIRLSTYAYFVGGKSELAAIRKDVSEMVRDEKYNNFFMNISGTVANKTAEATSQIHEEAVIATIYDRAYKILKIKYDSTVRLIDTVKKIISMRIQQMQLGTRNI